MKSGGNLHKTVPAFRLLCNKNLLCLFQGVPPLRRDVKLLAIATGD